MTNTIPCPVCGYVDPDDAPTNHHICPCCGTHFWYDDVERTHAELRAAWIADGRLWWSPARRPPVFCPVCGYIDPAHPPTDFEICDACGTEFGYHDAGRSHAELRAVWIAAGRPWWNDLYPMPANAAFITPEDL